MARVPIQTQPEIAPRPAPAVFQGGPSGDFGQVQAQQTAGAAANLARAGESAASIALDMQQDLNDSRVQDLLNGFVSGQQFTLYTDKDAFYRKRGQDAINGAQQATDRLIELKKETLGLAGNEYQRKRLGDAMDAHIRNATDGISRHVAQQSHEWEKNVNASQQALIRNQAALDYNDFQKIGALADAAEASAQKQAKLEGATGSDREKELVAKARSDVYTTAIVQHLQADQKRLAVALYDRVKGKLDEKDNIRLAAAIKSTVTDIEADDWIGRNTPNNLPAGVKQYQPQIQKAASESGVDPKLVSAVMAVESGGVNGLTSKAGAGGLMQIMPGTAKDLGISNVNDPDQAIPGGTRYLGQMLGRYNGDQRLALMAYNWGPGAVDNWLKTGSDPAKVPQETRDYVQKVTSFVAGQGVGFDKANAQGLVLAALNDPGLSPATRSAVATKITKESAALEATRAATIKGLRDTAEATTMLMILAPDSVPKNRLSELADGLAQAGEKSEAQTIGFLAQNEEMLRTFMTSADAGQRRVMAAMLSGKAKSLAEGLIAADEKVGAENLKAAREAFSALKEAKDIDVTTMGPKITEAIKAAQQGNDRGALAREIYDWAEAKTRSQAAGKAPLVQQQMLLGDLKQRIENGDQANATLMTYDFMQKAMAHQASEFAKDALAAGSTLYSKELGALPPMTDLAGRVAYAQQVAARRGGIEVLPFTQPEIESLKRKIDTSPPEAQAQTMRVLAGLPPEMIPGVAAAIAGKTDAGDPLSRSYAAALSFYADRTPAAAQIADQILSGARIVKDMGEAGKKAPVSSDAWQATLQERMGNVFFDMKGMPAVVADAVASVYTWQMHRAGRQGEKIDTDMLDKAITTVMGNTVTRHGQAFLPPVRGMDSHEVDKAVRSIKDADLAGLRSQEGDPITADLLIRAGRLTNAGKDGIYFVRIPDPRAGGDLRPVVDGNGNAWRLDLRPYVERARNAPPGYATDDQSPTGMRRRPVVPTLNDVAP